MEDGKRGHIHLSRTRFFPADAVREKKAAMELEAAFSICVNYEALKAYFCRAWMSDMGHCPITL